MPQHFDTESKTHVTTDDDGVVRAVRPDEPFVSSADSAQLAAQEYLTQHGELLGFARSELENLTAARALAPEPAGSEFRMHTEKAQFDTTTVVYDQTHFGLPVWEAAVSVHLKDEPYRVIGASSTQHPDLVVERPDTDALERFKTVDAGLLADLLGLTADSKDYDRSSLEVTGTRMVIYQYQAAKREPGEEPGEEGLVPHAHPTLPLPELPPSIVEGGHYVAAMVHFALATPQYPTLNWRAIIDVTTGAVLHLQAFVDNVNGLVFVADPISTAPSGPPPSATNAALNAKRTSVVLQGLNAPVNNVQALRGSLATVSDVELPTIAPPTEPSGTDFDFDARTNNFAAVNAYNNVDRFFRLVQGMGFSLASYFGVTPFPSVTDHRGAINTVDGIEINAHCLGTAGGAGILQTTFALADLGDTAHPMGIACDWRVVLHELGGHGILYPHVHGPNFGFSHSAGDSFAVILNDPTSAAPDRFVSFPWVNIGRRHDRLVAGGWGWYGVNDVGGYSTEQILSTTHFRIYRSIGGDAALPAGLGSRRFAARFVCYLILRAVASLTPASNPSKVDHGYVTALLAADLGDWTSEGQAGGAYGKVIRWAFEKQGLFQPAGAPMPVITEGAPPAVDVYIDDGRHGEYQYQPVHWDCHAIWNRRHADGLTTHEDPIVGVTNYAYVKIKNRGTQQATKVVVKAFQANPTIGLVYPTDWHAMTTAQLSAPNVAPNNSAELVVGPFQWTPTQVGHECLFMIATASGDPSNVSHLSAGETIPEWRLVPHDNNIGQRNVTPVPFTNLKLWLEAIEALRFTLKNPLARSARMNLHPTLPRLLIQRGWKLEFTNAPSGVLKLGPGKTKEIAMRLVPGKEFTAAELSKSKDAMIRIAGYANDILIGGMTYEVAPAKKAKGG
jgi:zinc metalloprotease ZmpB